MLVTIWHDGILIQEREIKPCNLGGKPFVRYKGKWFELRPDNQIWLDGRPPASPREETACPEIPIFIPEPLIAAEKIAPAISDDGWDECQREVIAAATESRLLVDACPGSGKTAVACARVAWLLEECGCDGSGIWLLGFTRIAVAEMRKRLGSYLKERWRAGEVNFATLDSFAWRLNKGFDSEAALEGNYDRNIENLGHLLDANTPLLEHWLAGLAHIIIDEAQDIVDLRASVFLNFLKRLPHQCGVTVLGDSAQAIYGFSVNRDSEAATLAQRLKEPGQGYARKELLTVHRASSEALKTIFTEVRAEVLRASNSRGSWDGIRDSLVETSADRDSAGFDYNHLGLRDIACSANSFALFRSNREVLIAAASIPANMAFRVRLKSLAPALPGWLAILASDATSPYLEYRDCEAARANFPGLIPDSAWKALGGGENPRRERIRIADLANIAPGELDPALLMHDLGMGGALLATIHAVKGREADNVHLYLPAGPRNGDIKEECRVLFVGATRAKKRLFVHAASLDGRGAYSKKTIETGRRYEYAGGCKRIEFGLSGDISPASLAGRDYYDSQAQVLEAQGRLKRLAIDFIAHPAPVAARAILMERGYQLRIASSDAPLCYLDRRVNSDLRNLLKREPESLDNLLIMDIRSCVIPANSRLFCPWRRNSLLLMPGLLGYPVL